MIIIIIIIIPLFWAWSNCVRSTIEHALTEQEKWWTTLCKQAAVLYNNLERAKIVATADIKSPEPE